MQLCHAERLLIMNVRQRGYDIFALRVLKAYGSDVEEFHIVFEFDPKDTIIPIFPSQLPLHMGSPLV